MTRRRRLLLFALPTIAVLLVVGWFLWPCSAITRENAAKIQVGMTLAEVEVILGGPARDESTGDLVAEPDMEIEDADARFYQGVTDVSFFRREPWGGEPDPQRTRFWITDRAMVRIDHDNTSCVTSVAVLPVQRIHEPALAMFRRWLRL